MSKNHRNRSWRAQWTPERVSRTAVHKSGATARVSPVPGDPARERVSLENLRAVDPARWNIGELTEQAIKLWREGAF